jgi:hypothetical protein
MDILPIKKDQLINLKQLEKPSFFCKYVFLSKHLGNQLVKKNTHGLIIFQPHILELLQI